MAFKNVKVVLTSCHQKVPVPRIILWRSGLRGSSKSYSSKVMEAPTMDAGQMLREGTSAQYDIDIRTTGIGR